MARWASAPDAARRVGGGARVSSLLAGALALAMFLTACPGGDEPMPSTSTFPPSPDPTAEPGGTLTVAVRDLDSFDPAAASGRGALTAVAQVFEPLTTVDPITNRVEPGAARSWRASDDLKTWRFRLADRRFHNGRKVTARDFKFAFDRIARRGTRSDAAFQLEQVRGFRQVKIQGTRDSLVGVSARRADLLVIRMTKPFAELAYHLSHPALGPLHRPTYRRNTKGLRRKPVGNGPFRVVRANADGASLERFDRYGGETPLLDGIDLVVADVEDGWRRFQDDAVDVAEVPPTSIEAGAARFGDEGFTPFWATLSFGLNTNRKAFRSPSVRRAISAAIDRNAIATTVYGNTRDPATGIVPRGMRGYVPEACSACVYDPEGARAAIDEAFPGRKPKLGIDFLQEASSRQVARAIAADLQAAGLRTELRPHARRRYLGVLEDKRHDIAQLGWLADVPSPDGFLDQQLRTDQLNNHTGFANKKFDREINRARRESDEEQRLLHYRRAEEIALRQMPLIPIVFFRNRTAVAEGVEGFLLTGAGIFDGTQIWLDR